MSKKAKIILISSISAILLALLVALFLIMFLPKDKQKITLNAPGFLNIQVQDGTKYLITDKNNLASSYAFYVYEGDEEPDNLYNYIKYESNTFYLNVTDIIVNAKNYHFYCKYIGNSKYNDSDFSQTISYTNKFDLQTPQIAINGTEISWFSVENATSYGVYANGSLIRSGANNYTVKNQNYFDIASYVQSSSIIDFNFFVVAFGNEQFNDSKYSNTVAYKNIQNLTMVNSSSFNWNGKVLSWAPVNNATGYQILINGSSIKTTSAPLYDFAQVVPNTGKITIQIKALGSENYYDSEYTALIEKTFEQKLATPQNLSYVLDDEHIMISWDSVENASSYSIFVNNNLVNGNVTNTGIVLSKADYSGTISVQLMANGHGYYLSSNKTFISIKLD